MTVVVEENKTEDSRMCTLLDTQLEQETEGRTDRRTMRFLSEFHVSFLSVSSEDLFS